MRTLFTKNISDFPWSDRTISYRAFLIFAILNGLIAGLVASTNVPWQEVSRDSKTLLFLLLAFPGHFVFMSLLSITLLFLFSRLFSWRNFNAPLVVFTGFLLQTLVLVDTKTFELYRFHLNAMVWNLMVSGEAGQILSFSYSVYLTGLSVIVLLLFGLFFLWSFSCFLAQGAVKHCNKVLFSLIFIVMSSGQLLYAYSDAAGYTPVTAASHYIPWSIKVTMKRFLRRQGVTVQNVGQASEISAPSYGSLNYPKSAMHCDLKNKYNVLVIMVDSLRFDMLTPEIMPNVHNFAKHADQFNAHYSTGNATRFGVFGFFYGLTGNYWFPVFDQQRSPVLLDLLEQHKYQSYIYAAVPLTGPEFDRTVFSRFGSNWQIGKAMSQQEALSEEWQERHYDAHITDAFVQNLQQQGEDESFFAFLFYDAPHNFSFDRLYRPKFEPYLESVNYLALNENYDPLPFLNRYKNAIHYDDMEIGRVLRQLEEKNLLESTVVIITSDHGQEFNDVQQNYWGHNSNFSDYQTRVPLLVHWPDNDLPKRIDYRTSHEDMVPTLVERLFHCQNPVTDYSTGLSLYAVQARENLIVSWSKRAVMDEEYIYVFGGLDNGTVYNADYEKQEGVRVKPETLVRVLKKMSEFLK